MAKVSKFSEMLKLDPSLQSKIKICPPLVYDYLGNDKINPFKFDSSGHSGTVDTNKKGTHYEK